MRLVLVQAVIAAALLCAPAPWARAAEIPGSGHRPTAPAVVTYVEGTVTAREPKGEEERRPPPRKVRPLQVLSMGSELTLPSRGQLGIVCSLERWILVQGARVWQLTPDRCEQGDPLPPGTYRSVLPAGGRLRSVQGLLALERETRGSRPNGADPLLLSPRNTAVLDPRPEVRWLQYGAPGRYELLLGGPAPFVHRIPEGEVRCAPAPSRPGAQVCRAAYPRGRPALPAGRPVPLALRRAERGSGGADLPAHAAEVRYLGDEASREVRRILAGLSSLPGQAAAPLLAADVLAKRGVLGGAIDVYEATADLAPEVGVTLADLYLAVGLDGEAERLYSAIEEVTEEPAIVAAIAYGLGRSAYRAGDLSAALGHFRRARTLYRGAADHAAASSIEAAIEETAARLARPH